MTIFMVLKCVAFMGFAISDSAILTRPPDVSSCVGNNVTIAWEYDNSANLLIASWTFNNGTLYNIMQMVTPGVPTVLPSSPLNVEFIENGRIMLISTLSSYTGTYMLSLTYSPGSPDSDSVDIIINDVPQPLAFQKDETSNTFNCSGSSSIPTVFRVSTSDGNVRYEASPYTSSDTNEGIECCYNGSAANCSNETFTAKNGTIYCQRVREASTTVPPTLPTTTQMIQNTTGPTPDPCPRCCKCDPLKCFLCKILPAVLVVGAIVGGILIVYCYCWKKKKCCFKEKNGSIVTPGKGKQDIGERNSSTSDINMKIMSSEKSSFDQELSGNNSDRYDETGNRKSTTVKTTNETSHETKPLRSEHDVNKVNDQAIQTKKGTLPPLKGTPKVGPDGFQESGDTGDKNTPRQKSEVNNEVNREVRLLPELPQTESSQASKSNNVEPDKRKKKKKKKRKKIEEEQIR